MYKKLKAIVLLEKMSNPTNDVTAILYLKSENFTNVADLTKRELKLKSNKDKQLKNLRQKQILIRLQ